MAYESPWNDPNQQYPTFNSPMGGSLASGYQQSSGVGYDPSSGDNWGYPDYTEQVNVTAPRGNTYTQDGNMVSSDPWGFQGEEQYTGGYSGGQGNWWDSFLPGGGDPRIQGMNLPLAAMAGKQFYDAGQFGEMGDKAAQMADPFGSQRGQYQTKLWDIYNDPAKVLADPQHQAIMNSQLNKIQARNRAGGYMGSGKDFTDMADYSAQENAKYLNDEKARLAMLAGAQFDPGNAANMYMQGQRLKLDAQNGAMGALGMMYMNNYGQPQSTQNRPGIPGYGNSTPRIPGMGGMGGQGGGGFNPGGLLGGAGGMNFGQGQPFAPDLSSPYWSQFTPGNYNPDLIAQQEMDVHQGNIGPGNTGYDEFGGQIDQWGNPFGTDYGSMGPFQDWTSGDELGGWGDNFDPFSWFED